MALLLSAGAHAQLFSDPFEPDDLAPLAGAIINGARPQFVFPPDFDPATELPEIERWTISGRNLATSLDTDWVVFYIDQYIYTPLAGQIRVTPTSAFSQANLRLEIAVVTRDSLLDLSVVPTILQSCLDSPVGESVVDLTEANFLALYRLRGCPGIFKDADSKGLGTMPYEFELEINDRQRMNNQLAKLSGTVRDVRNGQLVPGAAVFTQVNDITFGNPETGEWQFATVNASSIVLDFLAADVESIAPLDIGPVSPTDVISNIVLEAAPPGLIFFAGFEGP